MILRRRSTGRTPGRVVSAAFSAGIVARLVTAGSQALILAVLARGLSAIDFALMAVFLGSMGVLGFLDLGIGNSVINDVARDTDRAPGGIGSISVSSALVALCVPALIVSAVSWVGTLILWWVGIFPVFGLDSMKSVVGAAVFITAIGVSPACVLGAKVAVAVGRGTQNSLVASFASLLSLVSSLPILFGFGGLLWAVVTVMALPVLVNALQTAYLLLGPHRVLTVTRGDISLRQVKRTLRSGLPFLVINVTAIATIQSQSLVISASVGLASVPTFVVCLRLFQIVVTLFGAGLQQLWAVLASLLSAGNLPAARRLFWRTLAFSVAVHSAICFGLALSGEKIIAVWVGDEGVPPKSLIWWFAAWTIYRAISTQFSFLCNAADRVWAQAGASLGLAVFAVPASVVLTSYVGLPGPVIVAFGGHMLLVLPVLLYGSFKALGFKVPGTVEHAVLLPRRALAAVGRVSGRR